jgi:hypothetical protein
MESKRTPRPPHESDAVDAGADSCLRDVLSPRESDVRDSNEAARLYEVLPPVRTPRETHRPSPDHLRGRECPCCGYDLRGIEGRVCPECGEEYESARRRYISVVAQRFEWWGWLVPFRWTAVGIVPLFFAGLLGRWIVFKVPGLAFVGLLAGVCIAGGLALRCAGYASDEERSPGGALLVWLCVFILALVLNLSAIFTLPRMIL